MNADSSYWIGKDHTVCEDYALAGVEEDIAYAVVCDGCSASPDVDFGARVLAMSAKRTIKLCGKDGIDKRFGEITINKAQQIFDIFPYLHPQALDATLLATWVYNQKVYALLYGDGVIVRKTKAGIFSTHVQLSSNAPDYLSYYLDPKRKGEYDAMKDNVKKISEHKPGDIHIYDTKPFEPVVIELPVEEGDVISVISDGINSFRKTDNSSFNWEELVTPLTDYKTFAGVFVLRTLSAFKRKCLKENWTHSDDISVASIVI